MEQYKTGMMGKTEKTITESDVYLFAGITGDLNPLHINAERAKDGPFGKRVVHGMLTAGFISTVIGMKFPGPETIYMEQNVKFLKPVFIGDTITATVEITDVIHPEKKILKLDTKVENEKGELVVEGYAIVKAPEEESYEGN